MLLKIIRHEWKLLAADRTLATLGVLFLVLIGYAVWNGSAWVRSQQNTINAALAEEKKQHVELSHKLQAIAQGKDAGPPWRDPRRPSVLASQGARYAVLPPAQLAALSIGQSDLYPHYLRVTATSRRNILQNDEIENPLNLLAGRFDLAFVIVYLFPLLILALSYNLISGEREQGTLALVLSQPVPLRMVTLGKVLLRAAVIFSLAIGLSLVAAVISGANLTAQGAIPRLLLWIGVVALYGAFWFAVAALVNAFGRSSAANAVMLLGVWLLFVVIVPSVLNIAVNAAHPLPSRVEMIQSVRAASDEAVRNGSQLLARFYEDHPEMAAQDKEAAAADYQVRAVAVQQEVERLTQPVVEEFDRRLAAQQALVDRYRFLSPAIVVHQSLNDLAGTGVGRYQHFLALVGQFHDAWRGYFTPKVVSQAQMSAADVSTLPTFSFQEERLSRVSSRVAIGALGLIVPVVALCVGIPLRLRRYRLAG